MNPSRHLSEHPLEHQLKLSDNILRLRRERKLTQEQLADFIGVTKASVSKWETGQNTPDIVILPRLASFFDVTVDELIGYYPQLSKEQIRKRYQEYAAGFASVPFEEMRGRIQADVKQYYSCYPFLFQVCVLWLNHHMLAGDEEKQRAVLGEASGLCGHIMANCQDAGICGDTAVLQAMIWLRMGRVAEAAEALEEVSKPYRLVYQRDLVLMQAYIAMGAVDKADSFTQIRMYIDVLSLVESAAEYLAIHADDLSVCEETVSRIEKVEDAYGLAKLHPNCAAVFAYQAALCYAMHGEKRKALAHADRYVACVEELFSSGSFTLHGDAYFDRLWEWIDGLDMGGAMPRDREVVLKDVRKSFDHPAFAVLEGEAGFERLKSRVREIR